MDRAQKTAFLDVTISVCPQCGTPYADASWYVIELASDVQCGVCGRTWNPQRYKTDRILVEFALDEANKAVEITKKARLEL
jgi:hypothetical protein